MTSIVAAIRSRMNFEGRPKSIVVPENIDAVRELIKQDRHDLS